VSAFAREGEGDGLADSAAGPGDDGYFVFESFCVHKIKSYQPQIFTDETQINSV
jgi:hypothetical protein